MGVFFDNGMVYSCFHDFVRDLSKFKQSEGTSCLIGLCLTAEFPFVY